jgi:hypothetical protein
MAYGRKDAEVKARCLHPGLSGVAGFCFRKKKPRAADANIFFHGAENNEAHENLSL